MRYDLKVNESAITELEFMAFEFLQEMGNQIKEEARTYIHPDTGNLQQSIQVLVSLPEEVVVGTVTTTYALWVELGTVRSKPYPFMRPALDSVVAKINSGGI